MKVTNNAMLYGDVEKRGSKCELFALPVGSDGQITAWVAGNVKVYSNQTAVYAVFAKKRASSCKGFLTQATNKVLPLEKLLVLSKSAETAAKNAEAAAEAAEIVASDDLVAEVATPEEIANNVTVAKEAAKTARRLATEILKLALQSQAEAPVEEALEAPAEEVLEAPAEETTEAPAEKTTEAPVEEVVEVPAEEVVEVPAEEVVEAPAEEVVEVPAEEVVEVPAEEVVEVPAEEVVEAPAEEVAEAPAEEVAEIPAEDTVATKAKELGLEEITTGEVRTFKGSKYTFVYLPNSKTFLSLNHTGKKGGSPTLFEMLVKRVAEGARVPKKAELAEAEELAKKFPNLVTMDFTNQLCVDGNDYVTYKGELNRIRPEMAVYKIVCCVAISL